MTGQALVVDSARLARLATAVCEEMTGMYRANACIAGTRLLLDALAELGVADCAALAGRVAAFSPQFWARLQAEGRMPGSAAERERWVAETGGTSIGIGYGLGPRALAGSWDGHLVVIVARRWLADVTLGQASRPEEGLELGPVVLPVGEPFLHGNAPLLMERRDGTVLRYDAQPGRRDYRASPDWSGREMRRREVVKRALIAAGVGYGLVDAE